MHNDATWLLDFYDTFKDFVAQDVTDTALSSLAQVVGRFGEPLPHARPTLQLVHHSSPRAQSDHAQLARKVTDKRMMKPWTAACLVTWLLSSVQRL